MIETLKLYEEGILKKTAVETYNTEILIWSTLASSGHYDKKPPKKPKILE